MVPFSSTRTPSLRRGGVNAWRALCGGYALETVEECVIETQTGYQNRRPEQQIEQQALLAGLKAVHKVSDAERAAALVRDGEIAMIDEGRILFIGTPDDVKKSADPRIQNFIRAELTTLKSH